MPPTAWLKAVAVAAPTSPKGNAPTRSTSRTMFVTPDATVTARPSLGFSAVIKKLWNSICKTYAGSAMRIMRP